MGGGRFKPDLGLVEFIKNHLRRPLGLDDLLLNLKPKTLHRIIEDPPNPPSRAVSGGAVCTVYNCPPLLAQSYSTVTSVNNKGEIDTNYPTTTTTQTICPLLCFSSVLTTLYQFMNIKNYKIYLQY